MRIRFISLVTALLFAVMGLSAENIDSGWGYMTIGNLDRAENVLKGCLNENPAIANYFLGEIASEKGDMAAAKAYYQKGLEADPEQVLNQVGLAKLMLDSNPAEGLNKLGELAKARSNRRNVDMFVAIARIYSDRDMESQYQNMIEMAEKANRRSTHLAILKGDVLRKDKKIGPAASQYEQAILHDDQCTAAYVKIAQLYMSVNPKYAIEKLNALKAAVPSSDLADKFLARAYYNSGQYERAIEIYDSFYEKGHDLEDLTSYAASLFFTGEFSKAMVLINEGIAENPEHFVLNRLMMYSALETDSQEEGIKAAEKFFSLPLEEHNSYLLRDYFTYGEFLLNEGNVEKAIEQFNSAYDLADNSYEIDLVCRTASEQLYSKGFTVEAADFIDKLIAYQGEEAQITDYFTVGQYMYRVATTLLRDTVSVDAPERLVVALDRADGAFEKVYEMDPGTHLGMIFRARVNSLRDPETIEGTAKPFYEKTLEIIMNEDEPETFKRDILEVYSYLSYYHYLQFMETNDLKEKEKALEISNKMLELDPEHNTAIQLIQALDY